MSLPDGIALFVKEDCPTCRLVAPLLVELQNSVTVYSQDDASFPADASRVIDDSNLEHSFKSGIEFVPTLLRVEGGQEVERVVGWDRREWRSFFRQPDLGSKLPEQRPGCGSLSADPDVHRSLRLQFTPDLFHSRPISLGRLEDEIEACFDRGWSDGLPVVPPTPERLAKMLEGSRRAGSEIVAAIPPSLAEATVEKIALNAVLAGCKAEYLPVLLTAVEAACQDEFCLHGVVATTYGVGPVMIVNGPVARSIGMNSGCNVLGQGNRANATLGRALQLVIRNLGGGEPGGVDRAVHGNPGKLGFCFAEDEEGSPWESLAQERGIPEGASAVTLFAGESPHAVVDQQSRSPESLARSFAASLAVVAHRKLPMVTDAMLVVSPEHGRVFRSAGWSKERLKGEIGKLLTFPGEALVRGAGDIAEGVPESMVAPLMPKFRPGGLLIVHAGGSAGMFSSIIGGWVNSGPRGSEPVTREITT